MLFFHPGDVSHPERESLLRVQFINNFLFFTHGTTSCLNDRCLLAKYSRQVHILPAADLRIFKQRTVPCLLSIKDTRENGK